MRIMLKDVRICFLDNLFKAGLGPNPAPGQVPKFSATFLIPREHKQVKEIESVLKSITDEKWGAKGPAILKALRPTDKIAFRDGDAKPDWDGFEGNWYIKANAKTKPSVYDHNRDEVTESSGLIYSGCFVHASIDLKCYEIPQAGKGINAVLRGVQFYRKGDAFGGVVRPAEAEEFDEIAAPDEDSEEDLLN